MRKKHKDLFFRRIPLTLLLILVALPYELLGIFEIDFKVNQVEAATTTLTTGLDLKAGTFSGTNADEKEGDLTLTAEGTWGMRTWPTPDLTLTNGSAIGTDGVYTYVIPSNDKRFQRYISDENRWQTLAPSPYTAYLGADLTHLNGYIYAEFGGFQRSFSRYSIANDEWEDLADLPDLMTNGSAISTDGTYIYAIHGGATTDFWRYDPSANSWTTLTGPPATLNTGSDLVYDGGYLYTLRGSNTTTFYRYDISGGTWSTMTAAPGTINDNSNKTTDGDYIYVPRGNNTNTFYRYDISGNSWTTLANAPVATRYVGAVYNADEDLVHFFRGNATYDWWKYDNDTDSYVGNEVLPNTPQSGADLIYYSGDVYYKRSNSNNFYGFDIATNTWSTLATPPNTFAAQDTKGVRAGAVLYYFRGTGTDFYSYNTGTNTWSTLSSAPVAPGYGSSLAYPGSGDYIYATRGNLTSGFWRYSISGNTWDDASVADLPTDSESGYGARIISDGTDIYAITGSGIANILKYTVGTNTWSLLNTIPFSPYWGTDIIYDDGKIYAQSGYYRKAFWEYTISANEWRQLPSIPGYYPQDIGPYNGGSLAFDSDNDVMYSIYGAAISTFLSFTPGDDNYPTSGTWTSDVIDLTYVDSFTSLTSSVTTPDDSSVSFETRTSANGISWSSWQSLSGSAIQSPVNRYIQARVTLSASTDQEDAPSLQSLSINYTGDEVSPANPSEFTGSSQEVGGVALTSGQSYTHDHPYFTWSGASDGQTSVASYYVYFGTNASADPATAGNNQTSSTYTVVAPLSTGTYYLRIKTVDTAGNVSSATTGFTYLYAGVSPPTSTSFEDTSDFTGTVSDVNVADDEIKLDSAPGFWQQERLSTVPAAVNYGASLAYVESSNKLYTFRGNSNVFYEYDIDSDTWTTLANAPDTVYQGGDLVEGPAGYLYGIPGRNLNSFWRYEIATNTWSDAAAADAPSTLYYGSSLMYDGSQYIYVLRGNNDDAFYRYDTSSDSWESLALTDFDAPSNTDTNNIYLGGDLAYNGDTTYFAIQGNTRAAFASYDSSNDEWSSLPDLPALPYNGAQIAYDNETNSVYYVSGWVRPFLFQYDLGSSTWTQLPDAPGLIRNGGSMRNVDGELYILAGNSTTMWKYNIEKQSWLVPNRGFFGTDFRGSDYQLFNYGAELVKGDGNYYYMTRGNYDNQFVRYDASTGNSTKMRGAPMGFYNGSAMAYDDDDNKIYAIGSLYQPRLFVYDVPTDSWNEETQDPTPVDPSSGSALAYDGSRYLYWTRGTSTTFYRFDTEGSSGSKWSQMANMPNTQGYGTSIVFKDGYAYALRGNNQVHFYRYDPGGNSWSTMNSLPIDAYNDATLADGGDGKLIACKAENTSNCYEYDIAGDSWSAISNAPAQISVGGSAASNSSDRMYLIAGAGTNTYQNGIYSYVMQSDTSAFKESGSYESQTHDLGSVYRFANVNVDYTSADNTALSVSTRSSENGSDWSTWTEAANLKSIDSDYQYEIKSPSNRYLQVRFDLTSSDGIYSGVISDYSISYYQDTTAPTNPSSITGYTSATQSATIISDTWGNYTAPQFDWPDAESVGGATDTSTGSGVSGYYVYFGTDSGADAQTDGDLQSESSYTAESLVSGSTYYLKIKARDNAGNVAGSDWSAFTYKFDNVAPENPSTVTADPSGYTAVNDFDFAWSGATDSGSGIDSYCYKTTLNGPETCDVTETSVEGVVAGGTGASTFYVRAVDNAGNRPSTFASVSYYYSSTAPSAPQNLEVSPSSNSVNQFSFSWAPPSIYFGSQANLRYFWSVNAIPTAENVNSIGLTVTNLATDAYATVPGANIMYVVAKDEAGNIDYNNYASVSFTANTSAPGVPVKPDIADISVKALEAWKLAITWEAPTSSGSGVSTYKVYGSTTAGANCSNDFNDFSYLASTTGRSYVDTELDQVNYYYCVKACDSTNNCSAVSDTVTMLPTGKYETPAELTASPSATVKTKSAIIEWATSRTSNSFVRYGTESGEYGTEVGSSTQVTAHEIELENLAPGTTYYYQAVWTDEDGNIGESDEQTFTTEPAPVVSSVRVSNISINSALINFSVEHATSVKVLYGPTINYGGIETLATSKDLSSYTLALGNLEEGSEYHVQIVAEDAEGNVFAGDDYTFETLPQPKITAFRMQQVAGQATATLRLLWQSNTPITSVVTYYPTNNPASARDSITLVLRRNHAVILGDLLDETDYTIVIKGNDSAGNEAIYPAQTVTTAADLRAPEIENMNVESTITGVGDEARAQLVISWDTDEPATSQIEYSEGTGNTYSQSSQEDTSLKENHSVTISGLNPASIYHLRAVAKDKSNNVGYSFDTVVVTPKSTKDALTLVIENLANTFGFLRGINE